VAVVILPGSLLSHVLAVFTKPKAKPLKIITGRGKHSLNQVGVLKPAVRKALIEDGWSVGSWDGGLVVRQRQT
jgi:Smr domain